MTILLYIILLCFGITVLVACALMDISRLSDKGNKVFDLNSNMHNINTTYQKVLEWNNKCIVKYDNFKENIHIQFKIKYYKEYFKNILKIYTLGINGMKLPNDNDFCIFTLDKNMENYYDIIDRMKILNLTEHDIVMIKFYSGYELTYIVITGYSRILEFLKLKKDLYDKNNELDLYINDKETFDTNDQMNLSH